MREKGEIKISELKHYFYQINWPAFLAITTQFFLNQGKKKKSKRKV